MKQELKRELLLKDICARLPYEVKVEYKGKYYILTGIGHGRLTLLPRKVSSITHDECPLVEEVKPYLFPISSMTEEQMVEYESLCNKITSECCDMCGIRFVKDYYYDTVESIDYIYKNHIDIRGLIQKGLAIDATGKNIY